MQTLLTFSCALLLLVETAVADVTYRKFRMGSWEMRAKSCGETYQGYVSDEMEHLLPNMPGIVWEAAREEGAEEEEIEVLKKLFDEGRELALEKPWVQRPPKGHSTFYTKLITNQAPWYLKYCTHQPLD